MTAAVFDTAAIRARRLELFPPESPALAADAIDRDRFGSRDHHCSICPLAENEPCTKSCGAERGILNDGVTVT